MKQSNYVTQKYKIKIKQNETTKRNNEKKQNPKTLKFDKHKTMLKVYNCKKFLN